MEKIEVWRRNKGTTDAMVKVLETTSSAVTTAGYFTFASGTGNYLDDVVVLKLDGDTVETETQAYNAANEMTSHTLDGATTSFAYDQFGRMTQKTRTGGYTGTFYYNYGDKLTKVASNFQGEGTVTYAYPPAADDQKRRSRSVSGGAMTKYRVDQGFGVVNEENSGGTLLSTYIHHPGRQIGTVLATSEGSTASSGTWNYYFQDAIGSTRSLWDEDGERLGKYDYTPFGGKYGNTGEEITRKFTGHDWDNEARLYHTAYRHYSPDTGRWLTRDPLGMHDGPNEYAYVRNNPVSMVDSDGRIAWLAVFSIIALSFLVAAIYELAVIGWAFMETKRFDKYLHNSYSANHCIVFCEAKRVLGDSLKGWEAYAYNVLYEKYDRGKDILSWFFAENDHMGNFAGMPPFPSYDRFTPVDNYAAQWGAEFGYKSNCSCVDVCIQRFPDGVEFPT